MAHVGEEGALGLVGGLGRGARLLEAVVVAVMDEAEPGGQEKRGADRQHPGQLVVGEPHLDGDSGRFSERLRSASTAATSKV